MFGFDFNLEILNFSLYFLVVLMYATVALYLFTFCFLVVFALFRFSAGVFNGFDENTENSQIKF